MFHLVEGERFDGGVNIPFDHDERANLARFELEFRFRLNLVAVDDDFRDELIDLLQHRVNRIVQAVEERSRHGQIGHGIELVLMLVERQPLVLPALEVLIDHVLVVERRRDAFSQTEDEDRNPRGAFRVLVVDFIEFRRLKSIKLRCGNVCSLNLRTLQSQPCVGIPRVGLNFCERFAVMLSHPEGAVKVSRARVNEEVKGVNEADIGAVFWRKALDIAGGFVLRGRGLTQSHRHQRLVHLSFETFSESLSLFRLRNLHIRSRGGNITHFRHPIAQCPGIKSDLLAHVHHPAQL